MYSVDFILSEKNGFTLAPIFLLSVMSLSVILHSWFMDFSFKKWILNFVCHIIVLLSSLVTDFEWFALRYFLVEETS